MKIAGLIMSDLKYPFTIREIAEEFANESVPPLPVSTLKKSSHGVLPITMCRILQEHVPNSIYGKGYLFQQQSKKLCNGIEIYIKRKEHQNGQCQDWK